MGALVIPIPHEANSTDLRRVYLREDSMLPIAQTSLMDEGEGDAPAPAVWLVGAHGGAGVSTLAHMWAPMGDAGQVWPACEENPWCVLVCRSNRIGLERAHQAALQARSGKAGSITLLGIIIVEDAPGKCPRQLERKISIIEEVFRVWRVPYIDQMRLHATDELAQWQPGDEKPQGRRRGSKKKLAPVTEAVPDQLTVIAEDVFDSAVEAHELTQKK